MSVWYSVEGEVSINKSAHCSLKKLLGSFNMEGRIYVIECDNSSQRDVNTFNVRWCNSLDGVEAFNEINSIIKEILSFDKDAKINLNCEIRIIK